MKKCKSIGCARPTATDLHNFCSHCIHPAANDDVKNVLRSNRQPLHEAPSGRPAESSGGDNDYWVLPIRNPKRLVPYEAECEDIIEALQMTFQEGEAFKALWRKGMIRLGKGKPGDTSLRNAEKVAHFGSRMVAMESRQQREA